MGWKIHETNLPVNITHPLVHWPFGVKQGPLGLQ